MKATDTISASLSKERIDLGVQKGSRSGTSLIVDLARFGEEKYRYLREESYSTIEKASCFSGRGQNTVFQIEVALAPFMATIVGASYCATFSKVPFAPE